MSSMVPLWLDGYDPGDIFLAGLEDAAVLIISQQSLKPSVMDIFINLQTKKSDPRAALIIKNLRELIVRATCAATEINTQG